MYFKPGGPILEPSRTSIFQTNLATCEGELHFQCSPTEVLHTKISDPTVTSYQTDCTRSCMPQSSQLRCGWDFVSEGTACLQNRTTERVYRIDAHSRPTQHPARPRPPRPRARPPDNGGKQTPDLGHEFVFAHILFARAQGLVGGGAVGREGVSMRHSGSVVRSRERFSSPRVLGIGRASDLAAREC